MRIEPPLSWTALIGISNQNMDGPRRRRKQRLIWIGLQLPHTSERAKGHLIIVFVDNPPALAFTVLNGRVIGEIRHYILSPPSRLAGVAIPASRRSSWPPSAPNSRHLVMRRQHGESGDQQTERGRRKHGDG